MIKTLLSLTARQLLGRRRSLLMGLLVFIPVVIGVVYRLTGDSTDLDRPVPIEFASGIMEVLVITLLMPLIALVLGTAALGAEVEDGTAVYLLTKPIERWKIIVVKVAVAAFAAAMAVVPGTIISAWIIVEGFGTDSIPIGFGVAVAVGCLLYSAVFVALSAWTHRALIIGLVYVFVWEGLVTNLFNGLRWVSLREYTMAIADGIVSAPSFVFEAELGTAAAVILSIVVVAGSIYAGTRWLERFEIGERA